MPSTRDLSELPDIDQLRRIMQAMALLDAILQPDWEYRYYSFNSKWAPGEMMGSIKNGSGDELFAHFSDAGCWIKGFAHEAAMTPFRFNPPRHWPGVLEQVPESFNGCLREPAFVLIETTFCLWRTPADSHWQVGTIEFPPGDPDPDGSDYLLSRLDGLPETYQAWASEYYEREVDLAAVQHIYDHLPLTSEIIARLNSELSLDDLTSDLEDIGYRGL